jgi:leader peptidase (prepilin peptidase)/N-methyltransferase
VEAVDNWAYWLSPAVLGLFGLLIGSFLNAYIHRKPVILMREWLGDVTDALRDTEMWSRVFGREQPPEVPAAAERLGKQLEELPPLGIATPRSRCPSCGHQIRWYENIPVLSWLALRGRCSACKTRISVRYPIIELATAALFAAAAWKFGPHPATLAWCAALAALLAMSVIDMDTTYLPDDLTLPLLWGGFIVAALGWTIPLPQALWGAVAGYVPLWAIAKFMSVALGRQAMGIGDLKLLAALGAWLGWQAILPIILMASIVGLCINGPRAVLGRHGRWRQYPFGPFIAGGGLVVIFMGVEPILDRMGLGSLG